MKGRRRSSCTFSPAQAPPEADYVAALAERAPSGRDGRWPGGGAAPGLKPGGHLCPDCVPSRPGGGISGRLLGPGQSPPGPTARGVGVLLRAGGHSGPSPLPLKVLDNPLLDLELVSPAGSSPHGGPFPADRIAQIRRGRRDRALLLSACGRRPRRRQGRTAPGSSACWRICGGRRRSTPPRRWSSASTTPPGICRWCGQWSLGRPAWPNLRLLADEIAGWESRGWQGVSGAVRKLALLEEQGEDLPAATLPAEDAVQLMSIHASKGLEFPVVILADGARGSSTRSTCAGTLCSTASWGLPACAGSGSGESSFPPSPWRRSRWPRTRAPCRRRCGFCMWPSPGPRSGSSWWGEGRRGWRRSWPPMPIPLDEGGRLSPWVVGAADLPLPLDGGRRPAPGGRRAPAPAGRGGLPDPPQPGGGLPSARVIGEEALPAPPPGGSAPCSGAGPGGGGGAGPPAGLAVSLPGSHPGCPPSWPCPEIAKGERAFAYAPRPPGSFRSRDSPGRRRGRCLHRFMQFADYERASRDPEEEIRRLTSPGILYPRGRGRPSIRRSCAGSSPPPWPGGSLPPRRCTGSCGSCARGTRPSWPPYYPLPPGESTVIQWVADCVFVEEDGAVVVDYKTDRGKAGPQLIARYAPPAGHLRPGAGADAGNAR